MHRATASTDVFHAVADPSRRRILDLLARGELGVGAIAEGFEISLPAVSQHLRVLRDSGLVRERRLGRQRLYRLHAGPLRDVARWITPYERFWRKKLFDLGEHLKRNP
jgi:DNA-binding transcriptional ArsR family regulator